MGPAPRLISSTLATASYLLDTRAFRSNAEVYLQSLSLSLSVFQGVSLGDLCLQPCSWRRKLYRRAFFV